MKVALAGDHAGFLLKQWLAGRLARDGHEIVDLGAHDTTPSRTTAGPLRVVAAFGDIDVLVANAGVSMHARFDEIESGDFKISPVHETVFQTTT